MVENTLPRVYLVRHARPSTTWGASAADPGLDDLGAAQAQAAARGLLASNSALRPRRVISSPMRRCLETAKPLAEALGVEVETDPLIGEIPTPANLAQAERPNWLARAMAGRWGEIEGDLDYEEWRHGVAAAVGRYSQAAVFSHFVAINAVMSVLTQTDQVVCFSPDHASVTTLSVGSDGIRLVSMGDEAASDVL